MALLIAVGSQKGGPGKSTIARGLAVAFAQNGWSAKIADFDLNQMTATKWQQRRTQAEHLPLVSVEPFSSVSQALSKAGEHDVLIFDGAPQASLTTAEMAKACDLMVIPTGLSTDDLEPAVVLADALQSKHGIDPNRIVFALNHVGDSASELEEAMGYLAQTPFKTLDGYLPQKTSYSRAHDQGLSIIETPYKGPREQAERLIQSVMAKIDELNK
jgi:chromosome partitioning protein